MSKVKSAIVVKLLSAPVVDIELSKLNINPGQQEKRNTEASRKQLTNQIDVTGILEPIWVALWHGLYIIADGHGRFFYARDRGLKTIPAHVVKDVEPQELMARLNTQRTPRADFHMTNWAKAGDAATRRAILKAIPSSVRGRIEWLIDAVGERRARELGATEKFNPTMVQWAASTNRLLIAKGFVQTDGEMLEWMLKMQEQGYGIQGWHRFVIKSDDLSNKSFAASVHRAIKKGQPAKRMDLFRKVRRAKREPSVSLPSSAAESTL